MSARSELRDPTRFGPFLVVPRTHELHKDGVLIRLPSVPFDAPRSQSSPGSFCPLPHIGWVHVPFLQ